MTVTKAVEGAKSMLETKKFNGVEGDSEIPNSAGKAKGQPQGRQGAISLSGVARVTRTEIATTAASAGLAPPCVMVQAG